MFADENAPSPKYAISLLGKQARVKSSATVILENNLGDFEYEMTFESQEIAKRFGEVVTQQAALAQTEQVRKRLGHDDLVHKRASQRHAETVAKEKVKDQPDAPISAEDVMANLPVTRM